VLPEQQRDLPGELSGIVTRGEPGCFDIALDRFQEHTESSTLCTDGASVRLDGHRKTQSVGALRPSMAMECDPDVILDPATAHREITCSLGVSGGPAGVSVELPGTAVRGAPQTLVVGGEEVEAVPVAVELTATGSVQGIWKERIWFHPGSRLPLRIERALDLSGPVSFREDSTLRLVSLVPER
jgi:hypothetical protein